MAATLFPVEKEKIPLADRMRPTVLDEVVGQEHLTGEGKLLRQALAADRLPSMVFWGPPGSGKTTLARIIARHTSHPFESLSAVLDGVKEVRAVVERARHSHTHATILFVDEIHRFNRSQQDAFLPFVEEGTIILIGATTENPSFELVGALLSRCRVAVLHPLTGQHVLQLLQRAVQDEKQGFGSLSLQLSEELLPAIAQQAEGDARYALNLLETFVQLNPAAIQNGETLTLTMLQETLQRRAGNYDKSGDAHFNLISALHKSLRGSDVDAALYWLARMLTGGEDGLYIARRLVRFASEDIGNADPQALTIALAARDSYHFLGSPEGELALAQAVVYLATAPKSNALYVAYQKVRQVAASSTSLAPPMHILNAPTRLMKDLGYGQGYRYPHDHENAFVAAEYLPESLLGQTFYQPVERGFEREIGKRMAYWQRLKQRHLAKK
ncbi:MAG: replication-associated recombination protein A [Magnetococcales bacterium]|nr:replication-associated recombination protein A [Magnetococcales bacterium]NGZ25499.1 replication-associated recombination protein A [Magnetococcales bacterium]